MAFFFHLERTTSYSTFERRRRALPRGKNENKNSDSFLQLIFENHFSCAAVHTKPQPRMKKEQGGEAYAATSRILPP